MFEKSQSEMKKYDKNEAVMEACKQGDLVSVKYLVEKIGVDINIKDNYGQSALHKASRWGHFEIVKFLVKNGANINLIDKYDNSALNLAENAGHEEVARYLEERKKQQQSTDDSSDQVLEFFRKQQEANFSAHVTHLDDLEKSTVEFFKLGTGSNNNSSKTPSPMLDGDLKKGGNSELNCKLNVDI